MQQPLWFPKLPNIFSMRQLRSTLKKVPTLKYHIKITNELSLTKDANLHFIDIRPFPPDRISQTMIFWQEEDRKAREKSLVVSENMKGHVS